MHISLIIPAYNEEKAIAKVVEEAVDYVDEIIIIDDGSKDRTFETAKELCYHFKNIKLIKNKVNLGKVQSLRNGVKESSGDIIVFTDADFTYPAKHITEIVREIKNGADLAIGNRFAGVVKNIPFLNRIGNRIFSLLITYITSVPIEDGQTGLRAFLKKNFEKLDVPAKGLEYETKMTVKAAKLGYTIVEVPIEYRTRIGMSKLRPFQDGWRMFMSLLSIAYYETSLLARMILMPSFVLFLIGGLLGLISVGEYVQSNNLYHPYYPLLATLLLILATQLLSVGLILDNVYKKISMIARKL